MLTKIGACIAILLVLAGMASAQTKTTITRTINVDGSITVTTERISSVTFVPALPVTTVFVQAQPAVVFVAAASVHRPGIRERIHHRLALAHAAAAQSISDNRP
jgi:hypothetical protein